MVSVHLHFNHPAAATAGLHALHRKVYTTIYTVCPMRARDIGDRFFLLPDEGKAASCSASTCSFKGNRVYFMKNFKEDDGDLSVYDLEGETIEIVPAHEHGLALVTGPYRRDGSHLRARYSSWAKRCI